MDIDTNMTKEEYERKHGIVDQDFADGNCEHCGEDYKKQPLMEADDEFPNAPFVICPNPNCGQRSQNYSEESIYAYKA